MQGSSKVEYALNSDMAVINGTNSTVKALSRTINFGFLHQFFKCLAARTSAEQAGSKVKSTPKNVIVMVGDGMGIGQIEVAVFWSTARKGAYLSKVYRM